MGVLQAVLVIEGKLCFQKDRTLSFLFLLLKHGAKSSSKEALDYKQVMGEAMDVDQSMALRTLLI